MQYRIAGAMALLVGCTMVLGAGCATTREVPPPPGAVERIEAAANRAAAAAEKAESAARAAQNAAQRADAAAEKATRSFGRSLYK